MTALVRSWVETANDPENPFALNNLPFGVFSKGDAPRCAVAIGDGVLDLAALQSAGLLPRYGFDAPALNSFMGKGKAAWQGVRLTLADLLRDADRRSAGLRHGLGARQGHVRLASGKDMGRQGSDHA